MSDKVETRVVEMKFDNEQFERGIKQSMNSLNKFEKKLSIDNVSDGLKKASRSFSIYEVTAITALANISNRLVNFGVQLVKSLSVDNISAGWTKFGEKTTAVATMAAQKIKIAGKEITDTAEKMSAINEQLDKLNWFTDETSYNFTEMVNSIGKFTAAGQDLDVAVKAMMGIANWAALSGQNATKASSAMYQLAQAMGKGYIQLIDWGSIQNLSMDTVEFRETVLETAVAMGQLTKEADKFITKTGKKFTINQFAEELNSKWFTSDVLVKSLGKYSEAIERIYEISMETGLTASEVMKRYSSELDKFGLKAFKAAQEARTLSDAIISVKDAVSTGWMNTAERIFGSYDESKEFWTDLANELYDVFAEGGNFRNAILKTWEDLGGRSNLFKHGDEDQGAFWNIYDSIIQIKNTIEDAWETIFPKSIFSSYNDQVADLAKRFKIFTDRLKSYTATIKTALKDNEKLSNVFKGIFSLLAIGAQGLQGIRYALDPLWTLFKNVFTDVADRLSYIISHSTAMEKNILTISKYSEKLHDTISELIDSLNPRGALSDFYAILLNIKSAISELKPIETLKDIVVNFFSTLSKNGATTEKLGTAVKSLVNLLLQLSKSLVTIAGELSKYILPIITTVSDVMANIVGVATNAILDLIIEINGLFEETDKQKVPQRLKKSEKAVENISDTTLTFSSVLTGLTKVLTGIIKVLKVIPQTINNISIAISGKGILDNVVDFFDNVIVKINEFNSKVGNLNSTSKNQNEYDIFEPVITLVTGIRDLVVGLAIFLGGVVSVIGKALSVAGQAMKDIGDKLREVANSMQKYIDEAAKSAEESSGKRIAKIVLGAIGVIIGLGATILLLSVAVSWLRDRFIALTDPFHYLLETIADSLWNISKGVRTYAIARLIDSIGEFFLDIALSFGIFAMIPEKKLTAMLITLGSIIAILTGIAVYLLVFKKKAETLKNSFAKVGESIKEFNESKNFKENLKNIVKSIKEIANGFLKIAISFKLFSMVLKDLGNMNAGKLWMAIGAMATIFAIITAAITTIELFAKGKNTSKLAQSLKAIDGGNGEALVGTSVDKASSSKAFDGGQGKGIAGMLMSMAAILLSISLTLSIFSKLIDTGKLWSSIGALATIFAILTTAVVMIEKFGNYSDKLSGSKFALGKDENTGMAAIILALSISMISIAGSLLMLANFMSTSQYAIGNLFISIRAIALVLGLLVGTIAAITNSVKKMNPTEAGLVCLELGIIITALMSAVGALAILASIGWQKLIAPVAALTVIFGSLIASFVVISKNSGDISKTYSALTLLASISGLLLMFGLSMKLIEQVPWQNILVAMLGLIGIITSMVGALLLLEVTNTSPEYLIALSAAMVILGASLIIFAEGIRKLQNIDMATIGKGALVMGGALVILAGAASLLKSVIPFMVAIASAFVLMGAGLYLSAAAVPLFIEGIIMLADFISNNSEELIYVLTNLANIIAGALMDAMNNMLSLILNSVPKILEIVNQVILGINKLLLENGPTLIETITTLIVATIHSINEHIDQISDELTNIVFTIILKILKYLDDNVMEITIRLVSILLQVIAAISSMTFEIVYTLLDVLINVAKTLLSGAILGKLLGQVLPLVVASLLVLIAGLSAYAMIFAAALTEIILIVTAITLELTLIALAGLSAEFVAFFGGLILIISNTIIGMSKVIKEAIKYVFVKIILLLSEVLVELRVMLAAAGKVIGLSLAGGVIDGLYTLLKDVPFINSILKNASNNIGSLLENAKKDLQSTTNASTVTDSIKDAMNEIQGTMGDVLDFMSEATKNTMGMIDTVVQDGLGDLSDTVNDTASLMGINLSEGLKEGADNSSETAREAGEEIANNATDGAKDALGIHSPSTVFKEIGSYMCEGLAKGLIESKSLVENATIQTMNAALDSAREIMNGVDDDGLVIRPVMDLSSVNASANDIAALMSNISGKELAMSATLAAKTSGEMSNGKDNGSRASSVINNGGDTFNNVFNVTTNDPKGFTDEVDREMNRQRFRAKLAKGGI